MKDPDWKNSQELVNYQEAMLYMEERVSSIYNKEKSELIWLLEHPPLYTAGTSANSEDLLKPKFDVLQTGRGGKHTYHGPGQRVCYVLLDLAVRNKKDLKKFVQDLEQWVIETLAEFHIKGERRKGRVGIWVKTNTGEAKIAAIGIRVRKWVTFHGIAINLSPDLSHFAGIIPCGISEFGVTSFQQMGVECSLEELDKVLKEKFNQIF